MPDENNATQEKVQAAKTTNRFTQVEFFKFATWLNANVAEFKAEQTRFEDVAKRAESELGLTITEVMVRNALQELELHYEQKRLPNVNAASRANLTQNRLNSLAGRVGDLEAAVAALKENEESDYTALVSETAGIKRDGAALTELLKSLEAQLANLRGAVSWLAAQQNKTLPGQFGIAPWNQYKPGITK